MKFVLVALIAGWLIAVAIAAPLAQKRQTSSCTAENVTELNSLYARFQSCRASIPQCNSDMTGCDCCNIDEAVGTDCCQIFRSIVSRTRQCLGRGGKRRRQLQTINFTFNAGQQAGCTFSDHSMGNAVIHINSRDGAVASSVSTGAIGLCAVVFTSAKLFF